MTAFQLDHTPRRKRGRPRKVKQSDESLAKIKRILFPEEGGSNAPTKSQGTVRKRAVIEDFYVNAEVMNAVMNKAEEIKADLSKDHPTLIKIMLPSHVTNGFWLGLSKDFCDEHMPIVDRKVELEDESGRVWTAKYLAFKQGLSGGWRAFSIAHELVKGDVVIFELVRPTKFKVYIVRSNASKEADVDFGLLNSDTTESGKKCCEEEKGDQDLELQPLGSEAEPNSDPKSLMLRGHDDNDGDGSEQNDGSAEDGSSNGFGKDETSNRTMKFPRRSIDFKQVKDFDYFGIVVNGSIINRELPKRLGIKYYELCRSQDSFLHEHLLEGLNKKLIAGIIGETVYIADAIRAFEFGAVGREEFERWGSRLEAFEKLGMNVGFLLARLRQLMCLSDKANEYRRLRTERCDVEEKVRSLEAQLGEAKGKMEELEVEIKGLGVDEDGVEAAFRELANAPWSRVLVHVGCFKYVVA